MTRMSDPAKHLDPSDLAQSLDANAILAQLQRLAQQERELRILLRAARERQRMLDRQKGVAHAS